jgi:hypothetical protein
MQSVNDFPKTETLIPAISNYTSQLNDPYAVRVALQFISEYFSDTSIKLVNTIYAERNSYMTLHIPAEHLDAFIDEFGLHDDFDDTNFVIKLDKPDYYIIYTDFPELSERLDNPPAA